MKKILFSTIITCAIFSGVIGICNSAKTSLNTLTLANIEALAYYELGEVTISCSSGYSGSCFREAFDRWVMKGEEMYHPCVYTGCESDYC